MNANTIRTLTIRSKLEGGQETTSGLKDIRVGHERLVSALEKSAESHLTMAEAFAKVQRSIDMAARSHQDFVRVQQQMRAANDNASSSFRISGAEAASLANHLKNAALAAYALSPAFRALVNPLIPAALHAIGPAAVTAGKMVFAALTPLISFLARVALPIYAAAKAIQYLVNSVAEGVRDFQAFQAQQVALQNTLNATAGASGKSAAEINKLADGMGDIGKSREAAKALLEFQGVAGPTFDRALKAANDLAAAGMGNVVSAARAMGKALEEPGNGLDAFTAAGVRFTTQQRHLIKELVETGDRAGAVNTILGIVEGKVGGSAAAATNTLEGAYKQLNDALQRGSEQFGRQIVEVTRLQTIIGGLATAVNALNDIDLSKFLLKFKTIQVIARTLDFFSPGVKAGDTGMGVKEPSSAEAQRKANAASAQLEKNAYDAVVISLNKELEALHQSEVQKKIDVNLRKAGVTADSERGRTIAATTTQIHREAEAIKAAEEARRQDEATAKRQAEQLRRMDSDRQHRIDQLLIERQAIFLSAEAALVLKLKEEELAKERRLGIAETPQRVAEIDAWAKGVAKLSIENERLRNALSQVKDIAGTFATSFVRDLSNGVDVMDALRTAAGNLGNTLIDIGTKKLVSMAVDQAAGMFGAGSDPGQAGITGGVALATGGATAASEMIAGAMAAAEILAGGGALAGVEETAGGVAGGEAMAAGGVIAGTAINGPLVLLMAAIVAVGAALNMWSSSSSKAKQEEEAQARAWEQWQAAGLQLASYFAKANGTSVGNIRTQLQEQQSEAERLIKLRSESQGFKSAAQENADPIIKQIREAYGNYNRRLVQAFEANLPTLMEGLTSGFGPDSPLAQAFESAQKLGEDLQSKIADAETVYGKNAPQVQDLRAASQQFALSTLQQRSPLTEIETQLQELQGRARGLQPVLEGLGMSSIEAARKIDEGVKQAIDALKVSFGADLERQLNDLGGKGYFNDIFDALAKNKENLKNNELLGGGKEGVIQQILGMSAQGIVDQFKLTGTAFQELIAKFPELSGVVKEFSELVTEAAKRSADDIAKARQSIQDELFGVTNNPNTTEGQLAALEREFQRRRAEEILADGELSIDIEALYLARRGRILEDANQKALEEAKRLAEEQARIAESLRQRVQSFQDMTFNALNDTSTLEGQLAALAREEKRAREQEAIDGNGALAELNEAFFTRELAIRKSFGDRAIEEVKRVAEAERQAKNQAAKTVLEYLAGLQSGPNATVSAQENFANSLAFYTSNLGLAQGNPADPTTIAAVNKFPQVADNLEKAARALYGSSVDYQVVRGDIIDDGLGLPTVAQADDPLVVALRNTVTAVDILSGNTVTANTGLTVFTTNLSGEDGASAKLLALANDLGGTGGVSERLQALGNDLGGTGGVSQRLIDLAATVGTGNDEALRAKMISLAGEVNTASGKATTLGTEVKTAADKAKELATAIGTSDGNGVLKSLKLFGDNLSDIATQLLLHFNELDVDKSGAISRAEFTTSLGNTDATNSLFTSLDISGDNQLTQMELMVAQQREANRLLAGIDTLISTLNSYISEEGGTSVKSKIAEVSHWAQEIRGQTGVANVAINKVETATVAYGNDNLLQTQDLRSKVGAVQTAVDAVQLAVGAVKSAVNTVKSVIGDGEGGGSLQELTKLLTFQLTGGALSVGGNPRELPTNVNNNMILALNKIAYNTYATAWNTHVIARFNADQGNTTVQGTFAQGGVIPPYGLGLVSEHLNPTFLRAGPEPITVSPHMPAFGRAANDNRELIREVIELRKEVAALRKETAANTMIAARHVRDGVDENTDAVRSDSKEQSFQQQQNRRSSSGR